MADLLFKASISKCFLWQLLWVALMSAHAGDYYRVY